MAGTPIRRREVLLGAGGLASALALGGCARGSAGGGKELEQPKSKVPGKYEGRDSVVVWSPYGGANGQVLKKLAKKFNESQDDIYADVQYQGTYDQSTAKLTAALQAGKAPDLISMAELDTGHYLITGLLEPLEDHFEEDFTAQYNQQLVQEWMAKGSLYAVPFARSTPLLYYNRDLFEKAGLPDRAPKSWEELRSWGPDIMKLKVHGKPVRVEALSFAGSYWYYQGLVWQWGGHLSKGMDVTLDQGGAVEATAWFQRFVYEDKMAYVADSTTDDFTNGLVATAPASTASLAGIEEAAKFDVGAGFMPMQKDRQVPTGGSGWSMFAGAPKERKEMAAELLKFFAKPENAAAWSLGTGYLPLVDGAAKEPDLAKAIKVDPNRSVALDQLKYAHEVDPVRRFVPSGDNIILRALQRIMTAHKDPRAELSAAADKLQEAADKVKPDYEKYFG